MLYFAGIALALAAQGAEIDSAASPEAQADITVEGMELAADLILTGQKDAAINRLEQQRDVNPDDPAVLINLGIAYAHVGAEKEARAAFKSALGSDDVQDLETADGRTLDSRILAREALQMLAGGEFRTSFAQAKAKPAGALAQR